MIDRNFKINRTIRCNFTILIVCNKKNVQAKRINKLYDIKRNLFMVVHRS